MRARSPSPVSPLRRALWRALPLIALPGWLAGLCGSARAEVDPRPSEYQVKAVFLCKFGNFVEWPPQVLGGAGGPFTIAVAGAGEVGDEVARAAAGLRVEGRPIAVRKLRKGDSIAGVQILFIARSAEEELPEWLAAARALPVLTVTESEQGLELGSIVNFVVVDNKVRFDVAPPPQQQRAVRVDSRLLGVARKVVARRSS